MSFRFPRFPTQRTRFTPDSNGQRTSLQRGRTHTGGECGRPLSSAGISVDCALEAASLELLLAAVIPAFAAPISRVAVNAVTTIRCNDGSRLPFLSWLEGLGSVESGLR